MQPTDQREATYQVAQGDSIYTLGLGRGHRFEITGVRPDAVDLLIQPEVCFQASGEEQFAGALTLRLGEPVSLQTVSMDAWGNWVLTLNGIV
jgi:hypothetical protein